MANGLGCPEEPPHREAVDARVRRQPGSLPRLSRPQQGSDGRRKSGLEASSSRPTRPASSWPARTRTATAMCWPTSRGVTRRPSGPAWRSPPTRRTGPTGQPAIGDGDAVGVARQVGEHSLRPRRTRSRASGINGLSLVSKLNVTSVGFQCSIRRPAPSGRASIAVVRTTRLKLAATGGVNTRNPTVGASGKS